MDVVNVNLKDMKTSLIGGDKSPKDVEGFSQTLNMIMGFEQVEGALSLELQEDIDLESDLEESLAYLVEQSMLNVSNYRDMELNSVENKDIDSINLKVIDSSTESGIKGNLDEISKEVSQDIDLISMESSRKLDIIDIKAIENTKNLEREGFLQEVETMNPENKGLENKQVSTPLFQKNDIHKDVERILNLETFKAQSTKDEMTVDFKSEGITKDLEEKSLNKEDMEIKSFALEDIQNSFRKIESKDVYPKEVKTDKLSQENIDIFKDSIVKLIEIKDKGEIPRMNVKLIPRELGSIDISLKMEEGKLVAKILFENEQARQLFSNNIKDLNQNLQRQDVSIEEIQIDLSSNNDRGSNGSNRGNQRFFENRDIGFEEVNFKEVNFKQNTPTRSATTVDGGVSILV